MNVFFSSSILLIITKYINYRKCAHEFFFFLQDLELIIDVEMSNKLFPRVNFFFL